MKESPSALGTRVMPALETNEAFFLPAIDQEFETSFDDAMLFQSCIYQSGIRFSPCFFKFLWSTSGRLITSEITSKCPLTY